MGTTKGGLSSGAEYIAKTRQGAAKGLKRQHSQANQKYHQKAPSVSCGAHSGVKRIAFHYLGFLCLPRPKASHVT